MTDDITPAVPQDTVAIDDGPVVASEIAKRLLWRMCLTPVEFHHGAQLRIANVPVLVPARRAGLLLVRLPSRESVGPFDIAQVAALQR